MADIKERYQDALDNKKRHLKLQEAAEYYDVSERTLRRRIAEGKLAAVRVGPRSIRVRAEDVEALAVPIPTASRAS